MIFDVAGYFVNISGLQVVDLSMGVQNVPEQGYINQISVIHHRGYDNTLQVTDLSCFNSTLTNVIYEECAIENYGNSQSGSAIMPDPNNAYAPPTTSNPTDFSRCNNVKLHNIELLNIAAAHVSISYSPQRIASIVTLTGNELAK